MKKKYKYIITGIRNVIRHLRAALMELFYSFKHEQNHENNHNV